MATSTATAGVRSEIAGGPAASVSIDVAGPDQGAEWNAFVADQAEASGYHEWAWREVFAESFGHRSTYLVARRDGTIDGVLPLVEIRSLLFGHFLTSLPFVNYGGVLARTDRTASALADAAVALARARGCRHLELRHVGRRFPGVPCRRHKVAMHLALAPGMWERFDRKVRNQIRKAEKSGLVVQFGGRERLDDFYRVFARNMRDLGTPVYSPRFFGAILEKFPGRARVIIVAHRGAPVAAALTLRTRRTVEVPWASSLRAFNSLCPNHLMYWSIMESAVAEGCTRLDFGRSTPGEGTFHFKRQWGAEPTPLSWEYPWLAGGEIPDQGPTNRRFRPAIAIWKRCPLWLTNIVGPRIVRAIP